MTFTRLLLIAAVSAPLTFGSTVQGQTIRSEAVQFAPGTSGATIGNTITGDEIVDYTLRARGGQTLNATLNTSNASSYFNIMAPGAAAALFVGSTDGTQFSGVLPTDGEYTIRVYLMRNAARRDESASYDLDLSVVGAGDQATTRSPDFADGLSGGPDFWEVTGLAAGDTLNLRTGMGTSHDVIARLTLGEVVENQGCDMMGDTRWCKVERQADGAVGWVAGRYLREASVGAEHPQAAPQPQANGLVGNGEPFSATGQIPCSTAQGQPTRTCPFGVVRTQIPGNASIWIGIGDGQERFIMFESGTPGFTDATDTPVTEKSSDLNLIRIGHERYEIPDAAIFGG